MNDEHPTPKTDFPHPGRVGAGWHPFPGGTPSASTRSLARYCSWGAGTHQRSGRFPGGTCRPGSAPGGRLRGFCWTSWKLQTASTASLPIWSPRGGQLGAADQNLAGNFRAVRRKLTLVMEKAGVVPIEVELGTAAHPHLHQIVDTRPPQQETSHRGGGADRLSLGPGNPSAIRKWSP